MQTRDARPTVDLPGTVRGKTAVSPPASGHIAPGGVPTARRCRARGWGYHADMAQRGLEGLRTRLARERERAILAAATAGAACERSKKLIAVSRRLCDESRRAKLERGR